MNQKRKYKTDSNAFKEEAVLLVNDQSYSVREAAEAFEVNPNSTTRNLRIYGSLCSYLYEVLQPKKDPYV